MSSLNDMVEIQDQQQSVGLPTWAIAVIVIAVVVIGIILVYMLVRITESSSNRWMKLKVNKKRSAVSAYREDLFKSHPKLL